MENKKTYYNYQIMDKTGNVGIMLNSAEVKSVVNNQYSFGDAWCSIEKGEVWLYNFHISKYDNSVIKFDPLQKRKLLLHKREIRKLQAEITKYNYVLVPVELLIKDKIKLVLGLGKPKNTHNKKESEKIRDIDRDLQRYK